VGSNPAGVRPSRQEINNGIAGRNIHVAIVDGQGIGLRREDIFDCAVITTCLFACPKYFPTYFAKNADAFV